jgi:putative addiction module killer protein
MIKIKRTKEFDKWFKKLRDNKFKKKIANRFNNITLGNFGDHKRLDEFKTTALEYFLGKN